MSGLLVRDADLGALTDRADTPPEVLAVAQLLAWAQGPRGRVSLFLIAKLLGVMAEEAPLALGCVASDLRSEANHLLRGERAIDERTLVHFAELLARFTELFDRIAGVVDEDRLALSLDDSVSGERAQATFTGTAAELLMGRLDDLPEHVQELVLALNEREEHARWCADRGEDPACEAGSGARGDA